MSYKKNRDWFIDYNDLASQSSPVHYVYWELKVSNDGAGPYSNLSFKPQWVTRLRNTSANQFDFSQLEIGDEVTIRTDGVVTTTANNQIYGTKIRFDIWWVPFDLIVWQTYQKAIASYPTIRVITFYIWSATMRDNPAELLFESDAAADIKVNWFYISVKRR